MAIAGVRLVREEGVHFRSRVHGEIHHLVPVYAIVCRHTQVVPVRTIGTVGDERVGDRDPRLVAGRYAPNHVLAGLIAAEVDVLSSVPVGAACGQEAVCREVRHTLRIDVVGGETARRRPVRLPHVIPHRRAVSRGRPVRAGHMAACVEPHRRLVEDGRLGHGIAAGAGGGDGQLALDNLDTSLPVQLLGGQRQLARACLAQDALHEHGLIPRNIRRHVNGHDLVRANDGLLRIVGPRDRHHAPQTEAGRKRNGTSFHENVLQAKL